MALSSIAMEQTKATDRTLERSMQLLDYLASNNPAKVRFHALDMIMNIHSNASYHSAPGAQSRTCRHFFMGSIPKDNEPIVLNGAFHTNTTVMRFVVASAAEVELGALFHNCQTAMIFDKPWPTSVITNLKRPSTEIIQQPWASQTIGSS
jgi:hypothetical protein